MKEIIQRLNKNDVLNVVYNRLRDYRAQSGLVIVEGFPEVRQAIKAGIKIELLYIVPELAGEDLEEFSRFDPQYISKQAFAQIAFGKRVKGILALCRPLPYGFKDIPLKEDTIIVVLEGVEKPGNLGAVLRSCDGAGVDALIHCDGKTDIFNQHVVRSSMGTIFHMPTIAASADETLHFLRQNNFTILTASAHHKNLYTNCSFEGKIAILIGSEHAGLSPFWSEHADKRITIPMKGKGKCLNAAMTTSILVYEALRQRENKQVISHRS